MKIRPAEHSVRKSGFSSDFRLGSSCIYRSYLVSSLRDGDLQCHNPQVKGSDPFRTQADSYTPRIDFVKKAESVELLPNDQSKLYTTLPVVHRVPRDAYQFDLLA